MRKNQDRKLRLDTTTLRTLGDRALDHVAGGIPTEYTCFSCAACKPPATAAHCTI